MYGYIGSRTMQSRAYAGFTRGCLFIPRSPWRDTRQRQRRRRGAPAYLPRPSRVYSGTLIYDRSKLRGFTACLYWLATNAPASLRPSTSPSFKLSAFVRITSAGKVHLKLHNLKRYKIDSKVELPYS